MRVHWKKILPITSIQILFEIFIYDEHPYNLDLGIIPFNEKWLRLNDCRQIRA